MTLPIILLVVYLVGAVIAMVLAQRVFKTWFSIWVAIRFGLLWPIVLAQYILLRLIAKPLGKALK